MDPRMKNGQSLRKALFGTLPSKKAPAQEQRLYLGEMLESRTLLSSNFTFVVIADPHIVTTQPTALINLHDAVDRINLMSPLPKAVLFDGDLTDTASNAEFDALVGEMNRLNPAIIKAP